MNSNINRTMTIGFEADRAGKELLLTAHEPEATAGCGVPLSSCTWSKSLTSVPAKTQDIDCVQGDL